MTEIEARDAVIERITADLAATRGQLNATATLLATAKNERNTALAELAKRDEPVKIASDAYREWCSACQEPMRSDEWAYCPKCGRRFER